MLQVKTNINHFLQTSKFFRFCLKRKSSQGIFFVFLKPNLEKIYKNSFTMNVSLNDFILQQKIYSLFDSFFSKYTAISVHIFLNLRGGGFGSHKNLIYSGFKRILFVCFLFKILHKKKYRSVNLVNVLPFLQSLFPYKPDLRIVERKKYGHKKSRKKTQFHKR